jgi:hypothetical protein
MNVFRVIHDIVFPKRYTSAWARQVEERETRWANLRIHSMKEEGLKFSNRRRTSRMA